MPAGKLLILADVHANLAAFEAVLNAERAWDELIFLGDIVVGGPEPEACVQLLRKVDANVALAGNHDRQALEAQIDADDANPDRQWIRWTQAQLSRDSLAYLRAMRPSCTIDRAGATMRLHHGDFPATLGRFWPDWPAEKLDALIAMYAEPCIVAAHSHVQFELEHAGARLINPGSVGQPRLGQPLALYMVIDDGVMDFRAVAYDVDRTCRAMDTMPLPGWFIDMWKGIYRDGMLSDRYPLRDWQPLIDAGYR
ncbi:MAG: metallophosphoesterase family protein [Phycisphaeraceae bacterium]